MEETQPAVMQAKAGAAHCIEHIGRETVGEKIEKNTFIGVVKLIAEDGMAAVGEVYTYLVSASCQRLDSQQCCVVPAFQHRAAGDGRLAVSVNPFLDANGTGTGLADGGVDFLLLPCGGRSDDGKVVLGDSTLLKHVQQCGADSTHSAADDDAAGFEIETMHGAEIFAQLVLHGTL